MTVEDPKTLHKKLRDREYSLRYYYKNKDRIRTRMKRYHVIYDRRNKDLLKERAKKHYQLNHDKVLARQRERYRLNPQAKNMKCRAWERANPERVLKSLQARYLRRKEKMAQEHREVLKKGREFLFSLLGSECVLCGYNSNLRALQFDHINGGGSKERRTFGNYAKFYKYYMLHPNEAKEKLQILCANCNIIKWYS